MIKRNPFQNPQNAADFIGILPEDLVKRDAVTEVTLALNVVKTLWQKGRRGG